MGLRVVSRRTYMVMLLSGLFPRVYVRVCGRIFVFLLDLRTGSLIVPEEACARAIYKAGRILGVMDALFVN